MTNRAECVDLLWAIIKSKEKEEHGRILVVPIPELHGVNMLVHIPMVREVLIDESVVEMHALTQYYWNIYKRLPTEKRGDWVKDILGRQKVSDLVKEKLVQSVAQHRPWTPRYVPINAQVSGMVAVPWELSRDIFYVYDPEENACVPAAKELTEPGCWKFYWNPRDLNAPQVPEKFETDSALWLIAKLARRQVINNEAARVKTPKPPFDRAAIAKTWFWGTASSNFTPKWSEVNQTPEEGKKIKVTRSALQDGFEDAFYEFEWLRQYVRSILVIDKPDKIYPEIKLDSWRFPEDLKKADPYVWAGNQNIF